MENQKHLYSTVADFLDDVAKTLALFLEKVLPSVSENWRRNIVHALTQNQEKRLRQRLAQRGIRSPDRLDIAGLLAELDLAELLRVLDKNWDQICDKLNIAFDALEYIKAMQNIRNRWSHRNISGIREVDIYRDVDTMLRFAQVIKADDSLVQALDSTRMTIYPVNSPIPAKSTEIALQTNTALQHLVDEVQAEPIKPKSNFVAYGAGLLLLGGLAYLGTRVAKNAKQKKEHEKIMQPDKADEILEMQKQILEEIRDLKAGK